jgi:hypothetical protein
MDVLLVERCAEAGNTGANGDLKHDAPLSDTVPCAIVPGWDSSASSEAP